MGHRTLRHLFICLAAATTLPLAAQSSCSSDGRPRPVAVLERFLSADCEACWQDKATVTAPRGALTLDWILPGSKGEDAPLATAALRDGEARLAALERQPPATAGSLRFAVPAAGPRPRIAQGSPFNDYIGTSVEARPAKGGPFTVWLLLVEVLPAGTEGTPVARNLVRNTFVADWDGRRRLWEARAMQIHEGTKASRLRLVALVHDANGRLVGATQTHCAKS